MQIIIKSGFSKHINRALPNWDTPNGRRVHSEKQYREECEKANLIPYEQAMEMAKRNKEGKAYKLSREAQEIIQECKKLSKDGKSINLKERPKMVEKMVKHGAIKDSSQYLKYLPSAYQPKGGFKNV